MLGFYICIFAFVTAICLVVLDRYADLKDGVSATISEENKFRWADIKRFGTSYWLITASCVFVYMSIFPYEQLAPGIMQDQFSFSETAAGRLYALPYFISAVISPFLGIAIDKAGRRALFIMTSSILVILACFITIILPSYSTTNYSILLPLILLGIGYSIYAAALWASIPYTVEPKVLGSAFGLTTAI